jgi:membrane fusion protein, heavy metal efflux system
MEDDRKKNGSSGIRKIFFLDDKNKLKGISIYATILLCILSFAAAYFLFGKKGKEKIISTDDISDKFVYKTGIVKLINSENEILLNGKVFFDENNVIKIFASIGGRAAEVPVTVGNIVKKGDKLATIVSGDVSELIKNYKVAESDFGIAKKNLTVAENLYKSKFNSELDLITARKDYKKASDELKKASDVIHLLGIDPEVSQPYLILKSPIDGYIIEKNLTANTLIRPDNGNSLFTISDLKIVWVYANVFENDISAVKEGQEVSIATEVYPDIKFKGTIDNISKILDASSKALRIRIVIDNKDGLLRPEMYARVQVRIPEPEKHLAVTPEAVIFDKDNYFVIRRSKNHFIIKPIKVMKKNTHYTFIESGIQEGDTVITEGSLLIYNQIVNKL